jgi:hypothetical protein
MLFPCRDRAVVGFDGQQTAGRSATLGSVTNYSVPAPSEIYEQRAENSAGGVKEWGLWIRAWVAEDVLTGVEMVDHSSRCTIHGSRVSVQHVYHIESDNPSRQHLSSTKQRAKECQLAFVYRIRMICFLT